MNWSGSRRYSCDQRAASHYTLIGTAKLNELDPAFYLRATWENPRTFDHRTEELLPWNSATSLRTGSSQAA
jgi:transposase